METPRPMSNEATTAATDASTDKKMGPLDAPGWDLEGNYWDVEGNGCAPDEWYEKARYRGVKGLDASVV